MPGLLAFIAMATIWGLTWVAIKLGVEAVPPVFFAATRFLAAGAFMLFVFRRQIDALIANASWRKVMIVSILMVTFCYAPIFWGMRYVPSGLAAIINLSLIPVGLLAIGMLFRVENAGAVDILGILIGLVGLALLYMPQAAAGGGGEALGVAAIAAGTLSACLGSVLSKRWFDGMPVGVMSSVVHLIGGGVLLAISLTFEEVSIMTIVELMTIEIILSWLFLVVFGSVVAFTIYLYLLKRWGPLRAGLYAFVSPVIAVFAGYAVFNERLTEAQILASALLIVGAALTLTPQDLARQFVSRFSPARGENQYRSK